jgi:hypothetical protein
MEDSWQGEYDKNLMLIDDLSLVALHFLPSPSELEYKGHDVLKIDAVAEEVCELKYEEKSNLQRSYNFSFDRDRSLGLVFGSFMISSGDDCDGYEGNSVLMKQNEHSRILYAVPGNENYTKTIIKEVVTWKSFEVQEMTFCISNFIIGRAI